MVTHRVPSQMAAQMGLLLAWSFTCHLPITFISNEVCSDWTNGSKDRDGRVGHLRPKPSTSLSLKWGCSVRRVRELVSVPSGYVSWTIEIWSQGSLKNVRNVKCRRKELRELSQQQCIKVSQSVFLVLEVPPKLSRLDGPWTTVRSKLLQQIQEEILECLTYFQAGWIHSRFLA